MSRCSSGWAASGPYGMLARMPRSCRSRAYRKTVSLLLALALFGAPGRAAEPDPIYLRFEVFGGPGLHFLTLHVSVDHSARRYSLAVDAETRSLADLFVDLRSRIEARGRISADVLFPVAMRAETHRRASICIPGSITLSTSWSPRL